MTAGDVWIDEAIKTVRHLALRHPYLVADDLWAAGLEPPTEGRLLGPAIQHAQTLGLIKKTGIFIPTCQRKSHKAPMQVWRSRIYGKTVPFDARKLLSRKRPKRAKKA